MSSRAFGGVYCVLEPRVCVPSVLLLLFAAGFRRTNSNARVQYPFPMHPAPNPNKKKTRCCRLPRCSGGASLQTAANHGAGIAFPSRMDEKDLDFEEQGSNKNRIAACLMFLPRHSSRSCNYWCAPCTCPTRSPLLVCGRTDKSEARWCHADWTPNLLHLRAECLACLI